MSQNNSQRRITVAEMAPHVHSFNYGENKVEKITKWLVKWIDSSLAIGKICPNDFLPPKAALAYHIGVGQGTIQNAFRLLEDMGYVESKQKIGTYIKNRNKKTHTEKLTSKRDLTVETIKQYILEKNYKVGDKLISMRKLSNILQIPNTTIRLAFATLVSKGILKQQGRSFYVQIINKSNDIKVQTLVEKIAKSMKSYIALNYKTGEKLPATQELAKKYNASIKTIHDAIKILSKEGVVYTRRGKYGTTIANQKDKEALPLYNYEKIEQKIRNYIVTKTKIGDKLPSIKQFAQEYGISEKTIKKALNDLAEDGFLMFSRGRYGGTFVTDIPQSSKDAYKWLAIDSDYLSNLEN